MRRFLFETIHDVAQMIDRKRMRREANPSMGVMDSQSVKTGRRVNGARRKLNSPSCSTKDSSRRDGQPAPHTKFRIVPRRWSHFLGGIAR
jgi:hypothetical protein